MSVSEKYCIYFGTVNGVIGNTHCKTGELAKYQIFDTSQDAGITSMEWGRNQDEIIIGQKNGMLRFYDILTSEITTNISDIRGEGAIVGAIAIDENLIIGRKNGHIIIWNENHNDFFTLNLCDDSTLESICHNKSRKNIIGTGGEGNDFKLWDIETKKCIFRAKSMGHDYLNLPIPTSVRGISFLDDDKLSSCCTKEGYVLLYDERAQRRPISKYVESKASYTTITSAFKERQCLVGTTKGYMQLLDLRSPAKCVKTFKSFTGSISSIICDSVTSIVATVSLDRYLRIHNIKTKELLYKEYLKQRLTKLLLKPVIKEELEESAEDEVHTRNKLVEDEEYDKMFENMETIGDNVGTKSKRTFLQNSTVEKRKKSKNK